MALVPQAQGLPGQVVAVAECREEVVELAVDTPSAAEVRIVELQAWERPFLASLAPAQADILRNPEGTAENLADIQALASAFA